MAPSRRVVRERLNGAAATSLAVAAERGPAATRRCLGEIRPPLRRVHVLNWQNHFETFWPECVACLRR